MGFDPPAAMAAQVAAMGRWQRRAFLRLPAMLLAEPFEIFLVILAVFDSAILILHEIQGTGQLFLPYYYGPAGLWSWIAIMTVGNIAIVVGIANAPGANSLRVRKLEMTGLLIYACAFGFYGYTNLAVGLKLSGMPAIYPILSEFIVAALVLACLVRAISLASPVTALAVTRIQRIEMIKEALRSETQGIAADQGGAAR